MKINNRNIDHLVYCVPDLNQAIAFFYDVLGVQAKVGGQHLDQGTKNALINLGDNCYLEILAVDHSNKKVIAPRWMGVDLITEAKLTRWALASEDLGSDSSKLIKCNPKLGKIIGGSRKTKAGMLQWKMIKPLAEPKVDILPFMVDWSESDFHPTEKMDEMCRLESMEFYHPKNAVVTDCMSAIVEGLEIKEAGEAGIVAVITGPKGSLKI